MLCSTCGEKTQYEKDIFICKSCDSEFDMLDLDECLIPETIFVVVKLKSYYAIIDTQKQAVYGRVDTIKKANLIAELLNQHFAQMVVSKQTNRYIGH
jgi:predicted amidophosphoribosyltransferase